MAITIIQAGAALQLLDDAGGLTTLTLPAGVTLRTNTPPRWAVFNNNVVLVNTPSQPLTIDASGAVRILTPKPPRLAPILAGVSAGTLVGKYFAKETYVTQDTAGNILSESDYSPQSNTVVLASQLLGVSNADISPDAITLRRFYRTTDQGVVLFQWVDLDGNILTTIQDGLADAALSLVGSPVLGTPPRLTTIAEFRGRLWGVGDVDIDTLRYTEAGVQYAWATDNTILVPGKGADVFGVVALIPRREALGVGRRNLLAQVTGTGVESNGNIDFDIPILSRELGIESQESVCVFRDTAYFLWKDGVYAWGPAGITCVSDGVAGVGAVRSWFVTNSYFNQDLFSLAFAHIDPSRPGYRLFLASAGSSVVDSWIEYNIADQTWWGPHRTTLFSPTTAFNRTNGADKSIPLIGSAHYLVGEQEVRTDGSLTSATGIALNVVGKRHDLGASDSEKYWGELSLLGKPQSSGVLTVTASPGTAETNRPMTQQYDMTKSRQRLGRMGHGITNALTLTNNNEGEDVEVYGYIIDPVNELGRR